MLRGHNAGCCSPVLILATRDPSMQGSKKCEICHKHPGYFSGVYTHVNIRIILPHMDELRNASNRHSAESVFG